MILFIIYRSEIFICACMNLYMYICIYMKMIKFFQRGWTNRGEGLDWSKLISAAKDAVGRTSS